MKKTGKPIRYPTEAFILEKKRMEELNKRLNELTKKNNKIKMTEYFRFRASKPLFVYDDDLINWFSKNKRQKHGGLLC